ncbi:MAG: hypothetical protein ACM3PY_04235, partial [Omnitrophica WOR_2 bacterium]
TKTPGPTKTPGSTFTGIPTFSIVSVLKDSEVTIKTKNFPANQTFTARIGPFGTLGINGTKVGTTGSGKGGVFEVTYNIPAALKGSRLLSIRLESPQGFFAYNWFWNSTAGTTGPTSTPGPTNTPGGPTATPKPTNTPGSTYSGFPTFSIQSVVRDTSVTIKGKNFPPNQTFTVRMGKFGTLGIGGTKAGTYDTGSGGSFTATFDIPSGLKGTNPIAIRLESPQGYFAYNWFYNSTAP